jgi:hypothetical protein
MGDGVAHTLNLMLAKVAALGTASHVGLGIRLLVAVLIANRVAAAFSPIASSIAKELRGTSSGAQSLAALKDSSKRLAGGCCIRRHLDDSA